jgi:hypothetical protein
MSVSAAKSRVRQAQTLIESRRYSEVDAVIDTAMDFLVGLPVEETAEVAAELVALRTAAAEAVAVEAAGTKIRAAERELRAARDDIDRGFMPSAVEPKLDRAEAYVAEVPAGLKAELLAEVAVLRARLAGDAPAPAAEPGPAADAAPEPSADDHAILSAARRDIIGIRSGVGWNSEGVPEAIDAAAAKLAAVSAADEAAPLLRELEELRAEHASAVAAENLRRVSSELDRHFSAAEIEEAWQAEESAKSLAQLTERLAADDVRQALPADRLEYYQTRLAAATANRAAVIKADALDRAQPLLRELEERLASNPYAGLSQDEGFEVTNELGYLQERIRSALHPVPADDADILAVQARLRAADEQMAAAGGSLAMAKLEADFAERLEMVQTEFEGWQQETAGPVERAGEVPDLPATRLAIMRVGYLLRDPETQRIRAENAGNAAIEAVYQAAQELFDAAGAKLHAAYDQVLDHADGQPTPAVEADVDRLSHLETAVHTSFEGTGYAEPLLGRIGEIVARWKAEYAALMAARQELYDRLSAEAEVAWPAIVAATGATEDFEPGDTSAAGRTVLLAGVRNRAGWEFTGFDFCRRINGIPVGGDYEPHVLKALEHAWYQLKLDVNDRIPWDVVGVVTGPGKVGERTNRIVKDSNNREIGKIEEWPPVDCVRLRIVALHAGPVAVGPDQ